MCIAIPAKVELLEADDMAIVSIADVHKRVSTALLDEVSPGDYVLVHTGYALQHVSEEEAQETLSLLAES